MTGKKVFWTDESKFCQLESKGKMIVRRFTHEKFRPDCLKLTAQGGGGSCMIWGGFSAGGVGPIHFIEGKLNALGYKEMLSNIVLPYFKTNLPPNHIFIQDNAPIHKAKSVMQFFEQEKVILLDWPPSSPDLNPIENIWRMLKMKISKENPKNLGDLRAKISQAWENFPVADCEKLVQTIPARLQAVIDNFGYPTRF